MVKLWYILLVAVLPRSLVHYRMQMVVCSWAHQTLPQPAVTMLVLGRAGLGWAKSVKWSESVRRSVMSILSPWTIVHQVPLSMWFSRQESWSGLPFPSPEDLPDPGIRKIWSFWEWYWLNLNPGLLHFRQILYCLSHLRSPKITIIPAAIDPQS